jgi:hypothetical protein
VDHESQHVASGPLHFCVSSVPTERLNNCLDAASRDCFSLMSWHIRADACKRIAADTLH